MKIQFIESPSGDPYKLAYSAGTFADLPDDLAADLIKNRLAVRVEKGNRVTKEKGADKRATVSSNNPTIKRASKSSRGKKSS